MSTPHAHGVEGFFGEIHGHLLDVLTELHHPVIETAVMNGDGSLTTASGLVVPEGSYIVGWHLRPRVTEDALPGMTDTGDHATGASLQHHHDLPVLLAGDHVLVVWADVDVDGTGTPWVVEKR